MRERTPTLLTYPWQTLVVMMLSFRMVSKIFGNVPVARLPFEPPPFLQKLTHRGISGADPRECSSVGIREIYSWAMGEKNVCKVWA